MRENSPNGQSFGRCFIICIVRAEKYPKVMDSQTMMNGSLIGQRSGRIELNSLCSVLLPFFSFPQMLIPKQTLIKSLHTCLSEKSAFQGTQPATKPIVHLWMHSNSTTSAVFYHSQTKVFNHHLLHFLITAQSYFGREGNQNQCQSRKLNLVIFR